MLQMLGYFYSMCLNPVVGKVAWGAIQSEETVGVGGAQLSRLPIIFPCPKQLLGFFYMCICYVSYGSPNTAVPKFLGLREPFLWDGIFFWLSQAPLSWIAWDLACFSRDFCAIQQSEIVVPRIAKRRGHQQHPAVPLQVICGAQFGTSHNSNGLLSRQNKCCSSFFVISSCDQLQPVINSNLSFENCSTFYNIECGFFCPNFNKLYASQKWK